MCWGCISSEALVSPAPSPRGVLPQKSFIQSCLQGQNHSFIHFEGGLYLRPNDIFESQRPRTSKYVINKITEFKVHINKLSISKGDTFLQVSYSPHVRTPVIRGALKSTELLGNFSQHRGGSSQPQNSCC